MNEHEQNGLSGHNARWNILVDGVPVSLYRTTPNGEFWDVNLAMVEMFGYPSREELLARNPVDLYVFPEEREHWKTLIAQQGVVRNFEFQIRRYDGTILWLNSSARAVKDEQGRVIYYEGSLEDITERKRMEAEREHLLQAAREHLRRADALRQAGAALTSTLNYEEVLKRILEQMSQVVPHDTANIMLIKGEQAQVIQGHGYEDFDPQLVITTITLDMSKTPILQRMQATGQPEAIPYVEHNTEWVYARPEHRWIKSYAGTPIMIRNQVLGFLNVNSGIPGFYDRTHAEQLKAFADQAAIAIENARLYQQAQAELAERMRIEAELRIYQDQLEELVRERTRKLAQATREAEEARAAAESANQAKSTFLANMNHELRTPLNSILGFAQALERDSSLMGTQREHAEIIRRNGVHLLTLLDDILDFAKIDINRLELFPTEFVLSDMLSQLVDMTHLKAEHKGLSFVCEISDTLPHIVSGDQKRLRQILLNLLRNAVKYTEQGRVMFRVLSPPPNLPHQGGGIESSHQGGGIESSPPPVGGVRGGGKMISTLRFEIEDTGIGIAPDHLETIFQPFQQADPYQLQEGRTGLGLAISKRLVEMMGGQLQVTSTVGQGSTFWFDVELSVIDVTTPDVLQSRQDDASGHPSLEILITALAVLPAEWLATLKQAAEETDVEVLFEVIEQIRERDAAVADALAQLAEDFEYDKLLAVIQHTKKGGDAVEEHI